MRKDIVWRIQGRAGDHLGGHGQLRRDTCCSVVRLLEIYGSQISFHKAFCVIFVVLSLSFLNHTPQLDPVASRVCMYLRERIEILNPMPCVPLLLSGCDWSERGWQPLEDELCAQDVLHSGMDSGALISHTLTRRTSAPCTGEGGHQPQCPTSWRSSWRKTRAQPALGVTL